MTFPLRRKKFHRGLLFVLMLLPSLFIAVFSFFQTRNETYESTLARRDSLALLGASMLKERFDRLLDLGNSLAIRVRFRTSIAAGKWKQEMDLLRDIPKEFPMVDRVFFADPSGVMQADFPESPEVYQKSLANTDWYQGVSKNWEPYISGLYKRQAVPQINVVAFAIPIKSIEQKVTGILVLQVKADSFWQWSQSIHVGPSGFVAFIDPKGHILGHPQHSPQGEIHDYSSALPVQRVLRGEHGVTIFFNEIEKTEIVAAYAPLSSFSWGVVARQNKDDAFSAQTRLLKSNLVTNGAIVFLNAVFAFLVLLTLSRHERSEREALASEEKFRALAETANESIISANAKGEIVFFNRGAERTFGYRPDEAISKPLQILMPERFRELHQKGFERYLGTGEARVIGKTLELSGLRRNGEEFPLEISISQWSSQEQIFFTGILRDITEKKRGQQLLAERNLELEASNKELEAFSYSVSHDLRAPLRGIDGFSQAILDDYHEKLDEQGKDFLRRIRAGCQRLAALIDDLHVLSRMTRQTMQRQEVDLSALAQKIVEDLQKAEPERKANFLIQDGLKVHGDEKLIEIGLSNLLGNAWKFTKKKAEAKIEFGKTQYKGEEVYFVRDNGVGFDMQYAGKLFGAFQKLHTDVDFAGAGIGLAMVQRILRRHGGYAWAEGELGHGASFYFKL